MVFMKRIDIAWHRKQINRNIAELEVRKEAGKIAKSEYSKIKSDGSAALRELNQIEAYSRKLPGYNEED